MKDIVSISEDTYRAFAELISFNAYGKDYYSDKITVVEEDMEFTLSFSIYLHYEQSRDEDIRERMIITDVIPVWWNFVACEGDEQYNNDFSFNELKNYMLC